MEEFCRCSVCSRTPVVGEEVSVLERGRHEAVVCDLCLAKPRATQLGEAIRRERIRTAAGAENVQRIFPTPVPGRSAAPARAAAI
jgi:hypothetical protein